MKHLSPIARRALLCGLSAFFLTFLAQAAGLFRSLEAYSWDVRAQLLARPSSSTDLIRVIELDQNSLDWGEKENGLRWPWPREVYSVILDFCRRAEAATVSFDVLFSEPSVYGVEDDLALARAGRDFGRLVLSFVLGSESGTDTAWPKDVLDFSSPAQVTWRVPPTAFPTVPRASFPTPDVQAGAAALGTVSQNPDPDGIFRALRPLAFFADQPAPALFLAAYALHKPGTAITHEPGKLLVQPAGELPVTIPMDADGRAVLNFRGKAGTHQNYSAAAVIQSELRIQEGKDPVLSPQSLRGKHVFLGLTAPALLDLRPAPTDGAFSGVELHATALDNLLANDFFRPVPGWFSSLLSVSLCLAVALLALRMTTLRQLGLVSPILLSLPAFFAWGAYRVLYWLPFVPLFTSVFLSLSFSVMLAYTTEGRQRRFLKNAFSQYLSPEVINQIIKDPGQLKLGGERRVISIYFSDLAGFSSLSETLSPEELTRLLNEYLSAMSDIILQEGGTIDKYEGDAIIAFWNAPHSQEDHAERALRAAVRCQETLTAMQPYFQKLGGRELTMRIGLNTGSAVVGNMGSHSRFDYTMLGDAVNLASRLEGANKEFGTRTMVSQATFEAAGGAFAGRDLGLIQVVGRKEPTRVFEPMRHEEAAKRAEALHIFALALKAFQSGRIGEAEELFARITAVDPPAVAYLKICDTLPTPLSSDWTGVWRLTGK
ncbi:MAG: adenylate/guanylate cyclase domain-containing protein [Desulfovibrio sp.]|jgi:adenylate cyclase|nr:adenylate/guanylate cyclase domain-containing protein [Desulfovibrio sp.]